MGKSILLVHGRNFKPPRDLMEMFWMEALRHGISRDHADALAQFDNCEKNLVYYGDVSNQFLVENGDGQAPTDFASIRETLEQLKQLRSDEFTRENYDKLPGASWIKEALADALAVPLATVGLSDVVIESVAPDIREYWNFDSQFGSDARFPMIKPLKQAMDRDDEILVISHSLGTMVAYDTFWKFCRTGEYRPEYTDKKIDLWLTLGSPLADETVKRHLKGYSAAGARRYPNNVVRWINIAAEDDFISHDQEVANDYREMLDLGLVESITDHRIFNLAVHRESSNPHNDLCYLLHPLVSDIVSEWITESSPS